MITCAVTGATGLVGGAVARRLRQRGHRLLLLTRRPGSGEDEAPFTLGEPLPPDRLRGADALVHCAYDWTAHTWEEIEAVNVRGSIALFESALAAGVRRHVFISTVSAYPGCRSRYGRGKMRVEEFVLAHGGTVVRAGLVWGDPHRGMFGALRRVARSPVLPIFDGGRQPMLLVHADDLAALVERLLDADVEPPGEAIVAAFPQPILFADLLRLLARSQGRRARLVPIPGQWAAAALALLERLGLRLRFRSDNLTGLLNSRADVDPSLAARLRVSFRGYPEEFDSRGV